MGNRTVPLGRYTKIKTGKLDANSSSVDGAYPFFTCSREPLRISSYSYDCECVLVAGNGDLNVKYYSGKFDAYQRTYIIESADNQKLNTRYLYYFLDKYVERLREQSIGGVIKYIKLGYLTEAQIPLPPLPIQRKIADVLDRASALIEKRKAQIDKLDLLIKSQFVEMFGDPMTNPKGWIKAPMSNYLSLLSDFSANGSYKYLDSNIVMTDEPGYALMVRTTDLEKNDFENNVKYIDKSAYDLLKKSKLFGNEIIINKIGSAGKVYLMPSLNRPASLGRNAFMLRYTDDLNINFIYYLLVSNYGEKEIQQHIRGAVTKTITKDAVRSIQIVVPPNGLQEQFSDFVMQVETQKSRLQQSLAKLRQNYRSLMQKCFQGDILS